MIPEVSVYDLKPKVFCFYSALIESHHTISEINADYIGEMFSLLIICNHWIFALWHRDILQTSQQFFPVLLDLRSSADFVIIRNCLI